MSEEQRKPTEVHISLKFVYENGMYAFGLLKTDNIEGSHPYLLGLTNCTQEQLKRLAPPPKKARKHK